MWRFPSVLLIGRRTMKIRATRRGWCNRAVPVLPDQRARTFACVWCLALRRVVRVDKPASSAVLQAEEGTREFGVIGFSFMTARTTGLNPDAGILLRFNRVGWVTAIPSTAKPRFSAWQKPAVSRTISRCGPLSKRARLPSLTVRPLRSWTGSHWRAKCAGLNRLASAHAIGCNQQRCIGAAAAVLRLEAEFPLGLRKNTASAVACLRHRVGVGFGQCEWRPIRS